MNKPYAYYEHKKLKDFKELLTLNLGDKKDEVAFIFNNAQKENMKIFEEFKNSNVSDEDLIYFYLGCQMLNVVTTMNGRTLQWILHLRCCNKAQWQIRNIAKELAKQVSSVAPLLGKGLGPTCMTDLVCYEGKECCGLINSLLENRTVEKIK